VRINFTLLIACVTFSTATAQTFTTFQVKGSPTSPRGINGAGTVVGLYVDPNSVDHAFLRSPAGNVTVLEVPGSMKTAALGINASGEVVGICRGGKYVFLRSKNGSYTVFNVFGDRGFPSAPALNNAGTIAGSYYDEQDVYHGYVRSADGTISTFDDPGGDLTVTAINTTGIIVGSTGNLAFTRSTQGTITTFGVPGASLTRAIGINSSGEITGWYRDQIGVHSFIRSAGAITTFDLPGTTHSTIVAAINNSGTVAGSYSASDISPIRGFYRDAAGNFSSFDVPGGTYPTVYGINKLGWITGAYLAPTDNTYKGFILKP
jgi:uncharacterized membrane protein